MLYLDGSLQPPDPGQRAAGQGQVWPSTAIGLQHLSRHHSLHQFARKPLMHSVPPAPNSGFHAINTRHPTATRRGFLHAVKSLNNNNPKHCTPKLPLGAQFWDYGIGRRSLPRLRTPPDVVTLTLPPSAGRRPKVRLTCRPPHDAPPRDGRVTDSA